MMGVFLQIAVLEQSNSFVITEQFSISNRTQEKKCETDMFRDNILYINSCYSIHYFILFFTDNS